MHFAGGNLAFDELSLLEHGDICLCWCLRTSGKRGGENEQNGGQQHSFHGGIFLALHDFKIVEPNVFGRSGVG
jgi:hypothetical protein